MVTTAEVLKEMLVENTGRSILDSGGTPQYDEHGNYTGSTGGYGRAYERNTLRDFDNEEAAAVEFHVYTGSLRKQSKPELEVLYAANVYHWLLDRLEYDLEMDELFRKFCAESDNTYLTDMVDWIEKIAEERGVEVAGGYYGDCAPENAIINTWNHESVLSQDIQFLPFVLDDEPFVLLQIHNGADIRGGYTRPRVFGPGRHCDLDPLYMFTDGSVACDTCDARWYTDDGYHWYGDNAKDLKDYEIVKAEELTEEKGEPFDPDAFFGGLVDLNEYYQEKELALPVVYVDRETVICPECGKGHIIAL